MEVLHVAAIAILVIGAYYLGGREWHSMYMEERRERQRLMDETLQSHGIPPVSQEAVKREAHNLEQQMMNHEALQEMWASEVGGDDTP